MGRELGDDETFEAALVADRAMLVRPGRARASAAELKAFVEKSEGADVPGPLRAHQARAEARPRPRLRRAVLACLQLYKPPVDGISQYQSAEYELTGDQAWRRDYYYDGPGDQAVAETTPTPWSTRARRRRCGYRCRVVNAPSRNSHGWHRDFKRSVLR